MPGQSPLSMMQPPEQRARGTSRARTVAAPTLAHLGASRGRHSTSSTLERALVRLRFRR